VRDKEAFVKEVEGMRDRGQTDDKTVEAVKKTLDALKEKLKAFEDSHAEDLEKLKVRRVTSLGAAPQRSATFATDPAASFQSVEGQQAYAVLEQLGRAGDLAGVAELRDELNRIDGMPNTTDAERPAREERVRVAAMAELVDATARSMVERLGAVASDLKSAGGEDDEAVRMRIQNVLTAPPRPLDVPLPDALTEHVDPSRFAEEVFDRFAQELLRRAMETARSGAEVTKGGAVVDVAAPHSGAVTLKITVDDIEPDPDRPLAERSNQSIVKSDPNGRFVITIPEGKRVTDFQAGSDRIDESSQAIGAANGSALRLDRGRPTLGDMTLEQREAHADAGLVLLDALRRQAGASARSITIDEPLRFGPTEPEGAPIVDPYRIRLEAEDAARRDTGLFAAETLLRRNVDRAIDADPVQEALRSIADAIHAEAIAAELAARREESRIWSEAVREVITNGAADAPVDDAFVEQARAVEERDRAAVEALQNHLDDLERRMSGQAADPGVVAGIRAVDALVATARGRQIVVTTPHALDDARLTSFIDALIAALHSGLEPNRLDFAGEPIEWRPVFLELDDGPHWYRFDFTARDDAGRAVSIDDAAVQRALDQLNAARDDVESVELSRPRIAESIDDPHFRAVGGWGQAYADQWALRRIGIDPSDSDAAPWFERLERGAPCTVAIIGSGVDWTHPELLGQMWINTCENPYNGVDDDSNGFVDDQFGWNFRDDSPDVLDRGGHDTHIAGVIAARWNNGRGIAGVNPQARIMALKAANFLGQSGSVEIGRALFYAVDHGARVVNISYSGNDLSAFEQLAIDYATARGALVVVAAGNEASDAAARGLAGARGVLVVSGTGVDGARAAFSNWGPPIALAAPAMDVLGLRARDTDLLLYVGDNPDYAGGSAWVGKESDLYRASGTSFAAPLVSGSASILFSMDPSRTAEDVRRRLMMSAEDADAPGWDQNTGAGLVNARRASEWDGSKYVAARIDAVRAARRDGELVIEVLGRLDGEDRFSGEIQIAFGPTPEKGTWVTVASHADRRIDGGVLARFPAKRLNRKGRWSIRLIARRPDGTERESRATIDIE